MATTGSSFPSSRAIGVQLQRPTYKLVEIRMRYAASFPGFWEVVKRRQRQAVRSPIVKGIVKCGRLGRGAKLRPRAGELTED